MKHIAPDRIARFQTDGIVIVPLSERGRPSEPPPTLEEIHRLWDEKQAKLAAAKTRDRTSEIPLLFSIPIE